MNWGTRIVFSFIAFMAVIITMVIISMRQDVSLVATDYYKQEIAYQSQIDKLKNANEDSQSIVTFDYRAAERTLWLTSGDKAKGELHFYRPSDASQDVKYQFEVDGEQGFKMSTAAFATGLWKVKLTWRSADKDYYMEKTVVI